MLQFTVKADLADIGTGKPGTEGAVIQINPNSAEGTGSTGTVSAVGSGAVAGVRVFNSLPTFAYSSTGATLTSGVVDLLTLTVTADQAGDVGLYKLSFTVATSTATVVSPTFSGPNGSVGTTAITPNGVSVLFDSGSNTADATVGANSSKTYVLRGTVSITGNSGTTGSVSTKLTADTLASSTMAAVVGVAANSAIIWSPLATTSRDINTNDWTNGYALRGCFLEVGLGNDCTARVLSK
jgi:hypothetical protein